MGIDPLHADLCTYPRLSLPWGRDTSTNPGLLCLEHEQKPPGLRWWLGLQTSPFQTSQCPEGENAESQFKKHTRSPSWPKPLFLC